MNDPQLPGSAPEHTGGRWLRRLGTISPSVWLWVAVVSYFAVSFTLSWLRALEFQTTTWDQGLYQQALWTTAHGRAFYETADVETGGYRSLLEVHSVVLFYLLAPLYGALPYQTTLFAVQSAIVALAAVPLYLLSRDLTGSTKVGLVAGISYLVWTPTLSSNLYDFHPEAFLPVEIFAIVLLWQRGRYWAGFAVVAAAFLTLEIAPVLLAFVSLFFLWPATGTFAKDETAGPVRSRFLPLLEWLRSKRVRASLVLLVSAISAYGLLYVFRVDLLPPVVGTQPLLLPATGYVIGTTPAALGLALSNLSVGLGQKLTYWVLAVALLGFVPLFAPRALLASVPWFAFTLFSSNLNYVTLGFQYGFIAGATLLVAFAFGLPTALRVVRGLTTSSPASVRGPDPARRGLRRVPTRSTAVLAAFVALLALNVALSPADPAMQGGGLGSAYRISYDVPAGYSDVLDLVSLIPPGGSVIATDDLFPLVANDPNAYSFLWAPDPSLALPFDLDHLPTYVLLSEERTLAVSPWITNALYNASLFGVRGVAWSTAAGPVLLFEAGYSGPPSLFGPEPAPGAVYHGPSIVASDAGYWTTEPDATFSTVVKSAPGTTGTVWQGPDSSLPSGNYSVTLSLKVAGSPGFPTPNSSVPVLWVGASAFGRPSLYGWAIPFGAFSTADWGTLRFDVSLPGPTIEFNVQGVLLDSSAQVTLNYLAISPA